MKKKQSPKDEFEATTSGASDLKSANLTTQPMSLYEHLILWHPLYQTISHILP
jgi:hypothetical protein